MCIRFMVEGPAVNCPNFQWAQKKRPELTLAKLSLIESADYPVRLPTHDPYLLLHSGILARTTGPSRFGDSFLDRRQWRERHMGFCLVPVGDRVDII